jgi:glycosyltransferase involved in cell wall biosynthesis
LIVKLTILNSTTLHGWSAGSWYVIEMMRGLADRGHEIHVLVPRGRTAQASYAAGFNVHTAPNLRSVRAREAGSTLRQLRKLRDETIRPDIVLAHYGPDHSWWGVLPRNRERMVPVVRVRSHDQRKPARHPAAGWLNRWRTDAFIVSNEPQRRAYQRYPSVRADMVFRAPPGFDLERWDGDSGEREFRERFGIDSKTALISSVARFAPQKDHKTFFAAADIVASRTADVHFLAAGYEAEFDTAHLEEIAGLFGNLKERLIIWPERLPDSSPIVNSADIGVIHSSGSEAICRIALEFMASSIPLISTKIGILPEVIHDGVTGRLVPPGDAHALAGAMMEFLENDSYRYRMGEAGHRRLKEVFSFEGAVERFENALFQITEQV